MILDTLADAANPIAEYAPFAGAAVTLVIGTWGFIATARRHKREDERTAAQSKQADAERHAQVDVLSKVAAVVTEYRNDQIAFLQTQQENQRREAEQKKMEQALSIRVRHRDLPLDIRKQWKCCTCNESKLPIRKVRAGIRGKSGKYVEAIQLYGPAPIEDKTPQLGDGHYLEWLNAGDYCIFRLPEKIADIPDPDIAIRFIDIEGNPWQMSEGHPPKPLVEDDWSA